MIAVLQIWKGQEQGYLHSGKMISKKQAPKEEEVPKYIDNSFCLKELLDQGAFGKIYKAYNVRDPEQYQDNEYAVKLEQINAQHPQIYYEGKLYRHLHGDSMATDRGIPGVYWVGVQGSYNCLVMDLMGPSLETLFQQNGRRFSAKTVLLLMEQMISRIEFVHSKDIIHRDIKPDNFCMGLHKNKSKLYILDFGLAKKYRINGKHIQRREGKSLTGTARYVSINVHKGTEQACRDDLQSIGYVGIYLFKGSLPWQSSKAANKNERYQRIKEIKIKTSIESLCQHCPEPFVYFMKKVRDLQFDQKPPYDTLKRYFKGYFQKMGFTKDNEYDWDKKTQAYSANSTKYI